MYAHKLGDNLWKRPTIGVRIYFTIIVQQTAAQLYHALYRVSNSLFINKVPSPSHTHTHTPIDE